MACDGIISAQPNQIIVKEHYLTNRFETITPTCGPILRWPTRCFFVIMAITMAIVFPTGAIGEEMGEATFLILFTGCFVFGWIFFAFNYVNIDKESICRMFRIGRWVNIQYSRVRWDQVESISSGPGRDFSTELRLVTFEQKRACYSVPAPSQLSQEFLHIHTLFDEGHRREAGPKK